MKLYQYNVETGVYAGELYEDGDNIQNEEGVTMIVPPPYEPGQVPVFDKLGQEWRVVPLSIVRQLVIHGKN